MNRHDRRRVAARARGRRTGYLYRIIGGDGLGSLIAGKPGLFIGVVEHDGWCTIYADGACNCCPDITIKTPSGTVAVIDETGEVASKSRVS